MHTIFALASARGKSGVAVVRISGPGAIASIGMLGAKAPEARKASLRKLSHAGIVLDDAVVVTYPGPRSFTGEDVVELSLHGSVATVKAVLSVLGTFEGFRIAEPGEFTRRALENERIDLAQVEGLSDLIEAETEAQRQQALRVLSGALGRKAESWRSDLVRAAALLEATIDFVDEDVPADVLPEVTELLRCVRASLEREIAGFTSAERIRNGFEVAIVGRPNVGKSTLLNALAGREAAITSEVAGTTRDVIEVQMDLAGLPVTILDTAGLRTSDDKIEILGMERARARSERADLRVVLIEEKGEAPPVVLRPDDIVRVSKADLRDGDFSALTGSGLDDLVRSITGILENRASEAGLAIRERHRSAMVEANRALGIAMHQIDDAPDLTELIAEELRHGIRALDSLVGRIDVENLLDEIFASFCIGK